MVVESVFVFALALGFVLFLLARRSRQRRKQPLAPIAPSRTWVGPAEDRWKCTEAAEGDLWIASETNQVFIFYVPRDGRLRPNKRLVPLDTIEVKP